MVPTLLTLTGEEDRRVYDEQIALGVWPWLAKAAARVAQVGVKVGKRIAKGVKAARKAKKAARALRAARAAPAAPAAAPARGRAAAPGVAPAAPGLVPMRRAGGRDMLIAAAIVGGVLLLGFGGRGRQ